MQDPDWILSAPEAEIVHRILPAPQIDRDTAAGFEQWRIERAAFVPIPAIPLTDYCLQSPRRRALIDLYRKATHVNMRFQETPMSTAVSNLVLRRMDNNSLKRGPNTRAGVMVNGGGGQGKTEGVLWTCAGFADNWLLAHSLVPDAVPGTRDEHVPVAYVQTPVTAKPISTCKAILAFFNAPISSQWTLPDFLRAVRDWMRDHGVRVLVLDDITRLKMHREDDQDTLDMIRALMSMAVTLVLIGVDIPAKGLLREGKWDPRDRRFVYPPLPKNKRYLNDDPAATQTERRFDLVNLDPFSYDGDTNIRAWVAHLVGIEQQIRLFNAPQSGLLTTGVMPEYLFERTGGVVGLLERLIEDGCHLAMTSGKETLTETLLDEIDADIGDDPRRDATAGEVPDVPSQPEQAAPSRNKPKRKNGSFDDAGPGQSAIGA